MEFANDEPRVSRLDLAYEIVSELEASLVLFYTGVSRSSARVISEQSHNLEIDQDRALEAMHNVKQEALVMRNHLLAGDFDGIVQSMREGWAQKKATSSAVSNPLLDRIYETAMGAGALAGKVSGAGGGGFMWFYVPLPKRATVLASLKPFGGFISNCHFSDRGAHAWMTS
jgi:D-glycero-alpha-D-manno-heptose-7-phosphate kinase